MIDGYVLTMNCVTCSARPVISRILFICYSRTPAFCIQKPSFGSDLLLQSMSCGGSAINHEMWYLCENLIDWWANSLRHVATDSFLRCCSRKPQYATKADERSAWPIMLSCSFWNDALELVSHEKFVRRWEVLCILTLMASASPSVCSH